MQFTWLLRTVSWTSILEIFEQNGFVKLLSVYSANDVQIFGWICVELCSKKTFLCLCQCWGPLLFVMHLCLLNFWRMFQHMVCWYLYYWKKSPLQETYFKQRLLFYITIFSYIISLHTSIILKWHLKLLQKISIAFEKLAVTSKGGDHCKTPTAIFSHSKSKALAAIDEVREKNRRPDIDAIYEHILFSRMVIFFIFELLYYFCTNSN